jgi:uncharacterized protein (DUF2141 family)
MQRLLSTLTALAALGLASTAHGATLDAISGETSSLDIEITGIQKISGSVRIALFLGNEAYDSSDALKAVIVDVTGETISVSFAELEPGLYGVKLFHDVDGDGKMKTNALGMPTEPYAFSNNARGRFGPAKWKDASFEIGPETTLQTIILK